jgi:TrmH family RNA methyltransferase
MKRSGLSWRVVLVRPRNPLNIGAAARAMANFGFRELVVVKPYDPVWQETRSAVGAEEIVRSARVTDSLVEAIGEASLVIGTTSGSRRTLDRHLIPLQELPNWLRACARGHRCAALLFGSEKTGLSNEHLSYCHALVRIPTVPGCPSMNLGQAVAVCCYELARAGAVAARSPASRIHLSDPANAQSLEHVFERAARVLDTVGYLKPKSRAATLVKLRRLLLDLGLTNNDVKILGGVLAQIEWKLEQQDSGFRSQDSGRSSHETAPVLRARERGKTKKVTA